MMKPDFQKYVFGKVNDSNRQIDFHHLLQPFFLETVAAQVLNEYGLARHIGKASAKVNALA